MDNILYIGTFVSEKHGSISKAEELAIILNSKIKLCSSKENKFLRILDIIKTIILFKGNKIIIDTYSGQAFFISEIAAMVAKVKGIKIVTILRGGILAEFHEKNPKRISVFFRKCDEIYAPSKFLIEYFNSKGYKVKYLPNWVNSNMFTYNREQVQPNTLLWVRSFSNIYNPELAVKILAYVKNKYPNATLRMIGPDKGIMHDSVKTANELNVINSVIFEGPIPNNKLYKYYQTHAVFLNTTSYESFGVSLMEAASCGIPVVSSEVGEIPFIWEKGKDMLMVSTFSIEDFGNEVIRLLDSQELSNSISINSRAKSENYSWEKISHYWLEMLNS
jgi:glycosyltransferase involved in cell wall biosynthesis